tara:strand:- start:2579 stop:3058 length:480 start_codon:yes stop_codon:yes gene_type:complete
MKKKEKKISLIPDIKVMDIDPEEYKVPETKSITEMKIEVVPFQADRKKKTVKDLRSEMDERGIGYMTNWSKQVLLKRLIEEDERDAVLSEIIREKEMLLDVKKEQEVSKRREIQISEKTIRKINKKIDKLQDEINELCEQRADNYQKIKQAEAVLESLF